MTLTKNNAAQWPIDVVIMAAGKGTRMKSALPKVLHRLGGKPLLQHVIDTAAQLNARQAVVITGHESNIVQNAINTIAAQTINTPSTGQKSIYSQIKSVLQEPQQGTGHAVQQAVPVLPDDGMVLVLSGDVPLTQVVTLQGLIRGTKRCDRVAKTNHRNLQRHHGRTSKITQRLVGTIGQQECTG